MSKNYIYFWWHAFFLAITVVFTEINTVIPSLILKAGGNEILLGFLTSILVGFPFITKFFFAFFLHSRPRKKPFLLIGIFVRTVSLFSIGFITGYAKNMNDTLMITIIFVLMGFFSIGGAFAGISYVDVLGKTVHESKRKITMSVKQLITAISTLIFGFAARYVVSAYEYPTNYSYMFLIAGTSLLIASIGFWKLKEDRIEKKIEKIKLKNIFKIIKDLNKKDRNLFFYIIFLNLSAFSQTTIPFYIAYAKKGFGLTGEEVGNYIIFQVIGMIVATPIWYYISKNGSFKRIIKNCLILAAITPIYALLSMSFGVNLYIFTFLLTGFSLSARNIAVEGLLIEISQDDNRALYSGISGAFSIVSAIFPILSGIFISILGYNFIFILVSILVFSALLPLSKIKYSS
jgi:MFS family permease